jgi:hypothetical protein
MTELPGIGNLELHRPLSLRQAAANFGKFEFEAVAVIDPHAVLRFRHGIENRLATRLDLAGNDDASAALLDVDREIDLGEDRLVKLVPRRGEAVEDGGAGFGVLAGKDAQERITLRLFCAGIDEDRRFPVARVDGTRAG